MKHARTLRLGGVAFAFIATLAVGVVLVSAAGASRTARAPRVTVTRAKLHYVGQVNLARLASTARSGHQRVYRQGAKLGARPAGSKYHVVDQAILRHRLRAGRLGVSGNIPVTGGQVPGESGFFGISGPQQAAANGGIDLEPPDQGLCAGNAVIGEFINNALAFYNPSGHQLSKTVPSYAFFKQPSSDFFSDPRCYYDASTRRWFLTEFIAPFGTSTAPPTQFLAISNGSNPLGSYKIWSFSTADKHNPGCPCFGDFDQLGVDNNGIYIDTDEFGVSSNAFNGVIIYAVSKQTIEQVSHTGIPPTFFTYRLPIDNFGTPIYITPAQSPPGAKFAPNTEYFVESNGNAQSDNRLEVYAMHDTSDLATPAAPPMFGTEVKSERYAFPPDAAQKAGPIPLGKANQDPEGQLQADFDAIMEVTYTGGKLYA